MIEVTIGNEPIEVTIGDAINYYNGTKVESVNGKQGVVVLDHTDVGADEAGSASQALQDANLYTDVEVSGLDSQLATVAKTGNYNDLNNKPDLTLKADKSALDSHTGDKNNPHEVTKTQIGLGSVTDDAQIKLSDKDTDVTLSADSDDKIPSQKAVKGYVDTGLSGKVNTEPNKGLSTEDYTTTDKNKLASIANNATANDTDANLKNRANHTGEQAISTVTGLQTALDGKESTLNKKTDLSADSDTYYPTQKAVKTAIDTLSNEVGSALSGKVSTTGNETIAGVKTFSSSPVVPTATTNTQATNKQQMDAADALKEDLANKSTSIILGTSDTLYPTQKAVKGYVDMIIRSEVKGYITVPGNPLFGTSDFKVMKYHAKNLGDNVPRSLPEGKPWVNISQINAKSVSQVLGEKYHLITEAEWLTLAHNIASVASNWTGGAVGSGQLYRGHTDNAPAESLPASPSDADGYYMTGQTTGEQRRTLTLSNGEVIWDLSGNVYDWVDQTTTGAGSQPGAPSGGDYAWRQWNAANNLDGDFPQSNPAYGTPAAASWTSSQGIGQVYASNVQAGLRAFLRGGSWSAGSTAGAFGLYLGSSPSGTTAAIGFRVAR